MQNGAIAQRHHIVPLRQGEQLPDAGQAECFGFLAGIAFGAFHELRTGRIGNHEGRRSSAAERLRYL